ncbi:MAG: hypothetical protein KatS3mg060_0222 [Dehalococcoidia bacterium]|nr:MAG: hypothetical protein KatS3mg060_0222 [Dehalococcoidia bacterium]
MPGFGRPRSILPSGQRGSFEAEMWGWRGPLTPEHAATIGAPSQEWRDHVSRAAT